MKNTVSGANTVISYASSCIAHVFYCQMLVHCLWDNILGVFLVNYWITLWKFIECPLGRNSCDLLPQGLFYA